MSNQEPKPQKPGIDYFNMPGKTEKTTVADVLGYFDKTIPGKVLTTHFAVGGPEDIVTSSNIEAIALDDSDVSLMTTDAFGKPTIFKFDGSNTHFAPSIYEAGDFWFQDLQDERIWYGIYDEPLTPAYLRRAE